MPIFRSLFCKAGGVYCLLAVLLGGYLAEGICLKNGKSFFRHAAGTRGVFMRQGKCFLLLLLKEYKCLSEYKWPCCKFDFYEPDFKKLPARMMAA